jgi:predicted ABC-type ATPase
MLARLDELARRRSRFAFETTLASRTFAPWLGGLIRSGYAFHLVFLWLPSPELALARVAERVRRGGHDVPEATVRRRYGAGLRNFFTLYRPLATSWFMLDNAHAAGYRPIASGEGSAVTTVDAPEVWVPLTEKYGP